MRKPPDKSCGPMAEYGVRVHDELGARLDEVLAGDIVRSCAGSHEDPPTDPDEPTDGQLCTNGLGRQPGRQQQCSRSRLRRKKARTGVSHHSRLDPRTHPWGQEVPPLWITLGRRDPGLMYVLGTT